MSEERGAEANEDCVGLFVVEEAPPPTASHLATPGRDEVLDVGVRIEEGRVGMDESTDS